MRKIFDQCPWNQYPAENCPHNQTLDKECAKSAVDDNFIRIDRFPSGPVTGNHIYNYQNHSVPPILCFVSYMHEKHVKECTIQIINLLGLFVYTFYIVIVANFFLYTNK